MRSLLLSKLSLPALAASALLLSSHVVASDELAPAAKSMARAARQADVRRAAVLPFLNLEGVSGPKGRLLAQMFSSRLAAAKDIEVLAPSRVDEAMGVLSFKDADLVSAEGLSKLARALGCDALLTGSFSSIGTKASVRTRLYHVQSGMVVEEQDSRLQADWLARSEGILPYDPQVAATGAIRDVLTEQGRASSSPEKLLALAPKEQLQLRDSVSNTNCADAEKMILRLEASILEQKAAYWAGQTRRGKLSERMALLRSGRLITDPLLRERYEQLFRRALQSPRKGQDEIDVQRFITYDRLAYELSERCGK
ncbi:MAG: hypothetical protein WCU88_07795 [Elusimicrobiota bacterium]|jgi:hypothetical protein